MSSNPDRCDLSPDCTWPKHDASRCVYELLSPHGPVKYVVVFKAGGGLFSTQVCEGCAPEFRGSPALYSMTSVPRSVAAGSSGTEQQT